MIQEQCRACHKWIKHTKLKHVGLGFIYCDPDFEVDEVYNFCEDCYHKVKWAFRIRYKDYDDEKL